MTRSRLHLVLLMLTDSQGGPDALWEHSPTSVQPADPTVRYAASWRKGWDGLGWGCQIKMRET